MEYKKLSTPGGNCLSKLSIVFSVLSILLCGGLIYKVYDLQTRVLHLEKQCQSQEGNIKKYAQKVSDLQEDFFRISNQSEGFQWNTDTSNWSYPEDDSESDYEDDYTYDYDPREKLGAMSLTKDSVENPRSKREVIMRTVDGVPINLESYEDTKKNNKTNTPSSTPYVRKSRVMRIEDKSKAFRKVIKKPILKSSDLNNQDDHIQSILHRRRHRQRRVDSNERFFRFRPAIHLSGDVYVSNGWSHHEADHYRNWSRESWVKTFGMDQYFFLDNGYLRITEPGLYLVYAQVLYFDEHDTNGFYVYKNDEIILQCTTTSHSNHRVRKSNTCYTAGINHLNDGDRLRVHDIESYRYSIFRPGKSFFGAIKLSDVRRNV